MKRRVLDVGEALAELVGTLLLVGWIGVLLVAVFAGTTVRDVAGLVLIVVGVALGFSIAEDAETFLSRLDFQIG